jgi:glycosyltransferase involved in cell wall biosynthesis
MRPAPVAEATASLDQFEVVLFLTHAAGQLLPRVKAAGLPVMLDLHDVPDRLLERIAPTMGVVARQRTRLDARKWRPFLRRLLDAADLVSAVSDADAATFREIADTPVVVRPNGVPVASYEFVDHTRPKEARLLMTADFGYMPNIDATRWLIEDIFPLVRALRPNVTLDLVGRDAPTGALPRAVSAASNVPQIQPWFDRSDVFVAPLRAGGGTRLKILEAFAKGLPCVTTSAGCEGLPVHDGVHLLIADSTREIVQAVMRLLDDEGLRSRLAANGRALVESQFDWDSITNALADDLRTLADRGRSTA